MKTNKVISLCMLAVALLFGGMSAQAQRQQRKERQKEKFNKVTIPQSSWHDDIPTAEFLFNNCMGGIIDDDVLTQFLERGYATDGENYGSQYLLEKEGVAKYYGLDVAYLGVGMEIYDEAKRNRLYNEFKALKEKNNLTDYTLELEDDTVSFYYVY